MLSMTNGTCHIIDMPAKILPEVRKAMKYGSWAAGGAKNYKPSSKGPCMQQC